MKCRVCGYDVKDSRETCPMCGSRLSEYDAEGVKTAAKEPQMTWNTKDFPKPKKVEDVKFDWSSESYIENVIRQQKPVSAMKEDATEGFASTPEVKSGPGSEETRRPETRSSLDDAHRFDGHWSMPARESEPVLEQAQNAQARPAYNTGDAAQPQGMPQPQGASQPQSQVQGYGAPQPFTASGYIQTAPGYANTNIQLWNTQPVPVMNFEYTNPNIQQGAPYAAAQPAADVKDIIKEEKSGAQKEKFYTFVTKNEEFQNLLDLEYEKYKKMQGEEGAAEFAEPPASEKDLEALEKKITVNDLILEAASSMPDEKIRTFGPGLGLKTEADLEMDANRPEVNFDFAAERKKRLEEMAKAREEYFRSIDDRTSDFTPLAAVISPEANPSEENKPEVPSEQSSGEQVSSPDEKPKKSHWFLKLLLTIIIIAAILEGAVIGLRHFAPESKACEFGNMAEAAVIEGAKDAAEFAEKQFNLLITKIQGGK